MCRLHETHFQFTIEHIFTGCVCLMCKEQYYPYPEPFIEIVNYVTNQVITFELCENCIENICHNTCQMCKQYFLFSPNKQLFVDPLTFKIRCASCQIKLVRVLI